MFGLLPYSVQPYSTYEVLTVPPIPPVVLTSAVGWREVANQNMVSTGGASSIGAKSYATSIAGAGVGGDEVVNTFSGAP